MASDQQFCLRWNNHQNTLVSIFDSLLESGTLVDCTLAAEGRFLQAHKVVLSACSPYFAMLLREHYDKFPILILKDIKYQELQAMMNYMYRGEVNITQETLGSFLKAAESLQIRGLTDSSSNNNCTENNNNNGVARDTAVTYPYHTKKVPDSRKLVSSSPLLSQQRPRSPVMISQTKKYLKSSPIVENHQISNSKSTEPVEINNSSTKRRKLLPPIKSEGLVVTPINPSMSTFNNLDVNNVCDVPSQSQSVPAVEGKANVPSPSVPPKIESPHMDITPVVTVASKTPSAAGSTTSVTPEPIIKTKPLSELVKIKSEQLDDSYNEDTNDDSYTTEDNCENDRDENMQMVGLPFQNSQSGTNFDSLADRSLASQDGNNSLQDSPDARAAADEIVSQFVIKLSDSMPIDYYLSTTLSEQSHTVSTTSRVLMMSPTLSSSLSVSPSTTTAAMTVKTTATTTAKTTASMRSKTILQQTACQPQQRQLVQLPVQERIQHQQLLHHQSSPLSSTKVCFPCDNCGNVYNYKTSLARHVRFECGKDPQFKCPFCEHRTKHKSSLTTHIDCKHRQELLLDGSHCWQELHSLTKTQ